MYDKDVPPVVSHRSLKSVLRHPPIIISLLSIAAVLAFLAVTHLVNRFREQEKALARHLYAQGQMDMDSGRPEHAIGYFRAALTYNRSDFQYQLSLARALRDTGRTDESKSYLMNLWERSPEDGAVNLALGRLAVRQGLTDEAIHYYHNAMYGIWNSDPEAHRRNAQFELVDFLLRQNARPQAQAELITLSASLPPDPELEMRLAQMFARSADYGPALSEYETALEHDRQNVAAAVGAGEAAFQLHRYGTAEKYLETALKLDPSNSSVSQQLQTARLILEIDPFVRGISTSERDQRIKISFDRAGARLEECAEKHGIAGDNAKGSGESADTNRQENVQKNGSPDDTSSSELTSLLQDWTATKSRISRRGTTFESDEAESVMDLVFRIELQTQKGCSDPVGLDQALLLLAQDRNGVDR
jgi:tetratricopeptide (TPR) repeat protein